MINHRWVQIRGAIINLLGIHHTLICDIKIQHFSVEALETLLEKLYPKSARFS